MSRCACMSGVSVASRRLFGTHFARFYSAEVVPRFLPTVRSYVDRVLVGQRWVMSSFSNLGFIGKAFRSRHLASLAEFLFVFNRESPCDWLVWVWADALSAMQVTLALPQVVDAQAEAERQGPEARGRQGRRGASSAGGGDGCVCVRMQRNVPSGEERGWCGHACCEGVLPRMATCPCIGQAGDPAVCSSSVSL